MFIDIIIPFSIIHIIQYVVHALCKCIKPHKYGDLLKLCQINIFLLVCHRANALEKRIHTAIKTHTTISVIHEVESIGQNEGVLK